MKFNDFAQSRFLHKISMIFVAFSILMFLVAVPIRHVTWWLDLVFYWVSWGFVPLMLVYFIFGLYQSRYYSYSFFCLSMWILCSFARL